MAIHNAKDNSFKVIFGDHNLFIEFIRDFVPVEMLKNISASDVEDVSERYLPLFADSQESDTVKRINIKGSAPLFVIVLLEHESEVNHRAGFKMLQYIMLILDEYEKQTNKKAEKMLSRHKGFKFPPVLPIIFYDGQDPWTAEMNFFHKVDFNEAFAKYIPKFEYELVCLKDYSEQDLTRFGDALSLIMLIDKIESFDGKPLLSQLPADYIEKLKLNIPESLLKVLADVTTVLLKRINAPDAEVARITGELYQRRILEMFTLIDSYDVQATRAESKAEGKLELLLTLLRKKFGSISQSIEELLKKFTVDQLSRVAEDIFEIQSPEEIKKYAAL